MAKKKSRSANVARKREKRNRDRKSKNKQLAVEKQRRLPYEKMDEERLFTYLIKSRDLLEEPEIERLHFDLDLMYDEVVMFLRDNKVSIKHEFPVNAELDTLEVNERTQLLKNNKVQDSDEVCEEFRTEILPRLITPEFRQTLSSALTACENRLLRIGKRDLAEVAFVTQSLFEVAPPEIFVEHPLIHGIVMQTLCLLVEQPPSPDEEHPIVRSVLSEVLENEDSESRQEETLPHIFSEVIANESTIGNVESQPIDISDTLPVPIAPEPAVSEPAPSPDSLPAKALYKNFDGLAIKEVLKKWEGPTLEKETATQLDYFNEDQEFFITVTENRLQLHAHSEAELTVAMEALESHCQSALMYLAKTYEEGGKTDGTE
ncbi:MAG: hypothetical protein OXM61_13465 [Candidatus Poribacteria bacterium]|nr:hypothetical protein [Candidatus Poribacteria bacterium]